MEIKNRQRRAWLLAVVLTVACAGDDRASDNASIPDVPRTADPAARGLTESHFPRLQRLAEGVYSYEQLRSAGEERFTTVSLIVVGDGEVLVADGQGSVVETTRLVGAVAGLTNAPIRHVVVASDHGDHTAGNSAFPSDATYYAHPTSIETLASAARSTNRPADAPPVVVPDRSVPDRAIVTLGTGATAREVHLLHLGRAHTGGDLLVYLPEERILFLSEAYLNRIFPAMRSAYPSEWVAVLDRALDMNVDTFVPGHGFVEHPAVLREELVNYRNAMARVIEATALLHARGLTADEAVEQADFGDLESWSLVSSQKPVTIRRIYAELDGRLGPGGP